MHRANVSSLLSAVLTALALLLPSAASAAWPANPNLNLPVCTATGDQLNPAIVSDGAGGAIVVWADARSGNKDIYAQRVSADGIALWTAGGVVLCAAPGDQTNPTLIADGLGGAIAAWHDIRSGTNYDIYARQVSADGTPQGTADGVVVCINTAHQTFPTLASDGAGGAIVTWFDIRSSNYDIYAQRFAAGAAQWTADGVAICTAARHQEYPTIVPDGTGGAIITWFDQRTGPNYTFSDIYAQRIAGDGTVQWSADGVPLCTATGDQSNPTIVSDGASGAIVTWFDYRSGNYDIYSQRVAANGSVEWTSDGVALSTAPGEQAYPTIVSDGVGGAIATWRDYSSAIDYDIYAQRVNSLGAIQWTVNGVPVCVAPDNQYDPTIASDAAGGAIITWYDYRSGESNVYARRILPNGSPQWLADGVALCTASGSQIVPVIAPDGSGGAIVTWYDSRGGDYDIYAQRVDQGGVVGGALRVDVPIEAGVAFALEPLRPNPTRGNSLKLHFTLPAEAPASLQMVDVRGRLVASREVGSLGAGRHAVDLTAGRRLPAGIYLVRLRQGGLQRVTRAVVLD